MNDDILLAEAMRAAGDVVKRYAQPLRDEVESELLVTVAECYLRYQSGAITDGGWYGYVRRACTRRAWRVYRADRRLQAVKHRAILNVDTMERMVEDFNRWVAEKRGGRPT